MKSIFLLLSCYLTASSVAYDLQKQCEVRLDQYQRIQVLTVVDNKVVFAIGEQYFLIDNDKLRCK